MKKLFALFILTSFFSFSQTKVYDIENLKLNTSSSHYGVVLTNNNTVYFSAPILNYKNIQRKKNKKHLIISLFEGKLDSRGQITDIKKFQGKKSTYNTSSGVVSPDGKYIYLTSNYNKKGKTYKEKGKSYNLFIERGEFVKGKGWTNFITLSFCDPDYSFGHPAISPDGKDLYFVSNIPSAKGPTDIFKVSIIGDNEYTKPKNLGSMINSPRKEMFPFISEDGVLYFSSDRANGIGGLDIYSSKILANSKFENAKLLSQPINSKGDDFCFVLDGENESGYFSSNRKGGKGDDDIYRFTAKKMKNQNTLLVSRD